MQPEFSRLIAVDRIPPGGATEHIAASQEERAALAARFEIVAIHELKAILELEPWRRGGIKVSGRLDAVIEQTCVVTLEPFREKLSEQVTRFFAGHNAPGPSPVVHSVESLEDDEPDVISGGSIDLGEVVAEALGLALDPYPRKPDAEFKLQETENEGRQSVSPFVALKTLGLTDKPKSRR